MIASCIAPKLSVECGSLDGKSIYQLADNLSFQEPTQAGHRDDHFAVEVEDGRSSIRGQREIPGPVEPNRVKLGLVTKLTGARRSVNPHVLQPCKGGGAGQTTENVQLITRDDVAESEYGPRSILMGTRALRADRRPEVEALGRSSGQPGDWRSRSSVP